ncbi:hypothetical protein U0070_025885 [Myodes glareolus]|uniref:glutathione transferase n=2 Tax=Myodes glareolus TaxID=447135 RepID=A0AAW0HTW6_MYOGA
MWQEKRKPEFLKGLPGQLKLYSEFLGKWPWFAGDKVKRITFADFLVYDVLDQHRMFEPTCLDAFPNLKNFVAHFELGHAIRLLLEYTETSYEEKRYAMGDAPDYDRSQWLNDKFKLGLDFPNITQSNAILRYLGRKHNLCGETEEERVRVDIVEKQVMDTRIQMGMLCYSPDFEKRKPEFLKGLPGQLKLYSEFLGKRPWFAGDKITFADFLVYDVLDQHRVFEPTCLDAFPNLKDFVTRFEGLKKISAYMKSNRFLPSPLYLKQAMWGIFCVNHPGGCSLWKRSMSVKTGAPDYDRSQWLNEKFKLGLDFPNLPYLIDGPHKITQSNAILRYLGRKHNLCGETEEERILVDILENQLMDNRMMLARLCYNPDFEKLKPGYLEQLPGMMKLYSEFLGKRPWFAGDKITFVDFIAYDVLERNQVFEPKCLEAFPNLKDFISRFEGLKKISEYMKTSRFLPRPVFTKMATWGSK